MRATWWQTRSTLQLAFSMDGAKAEECAVHSVTEESMLQLTWEEGIAFNAKFHQAVLPASAQWKVVGKGKVNLSIKKGSEARTHWPRPFEHKLTTIKPNWDRWIDEDDDQEPKVDVSEGSGDSGGGGEDGGVTAATQSAADLLAAMSFDAEALALDDAKAWLKDWSDRFKSEERMLTMAMLWNAMPGETRITSAKRLVGILRAGDEAMAALEGRMKGGDWATYKLDTSNYTGAGVKRPRQWVESFEAMAAAEQVEVMELMFGALSSDEQKLVAATFM